MGLKKRSSKKPKMKPDHIPKVLVVEDDNDDQEISDNKNNNNGGNDYSQSLIKRSSTPPLPRLFLRSTSEPITFDETHKSWQKEHPPALASFDQMMKPAREKKIVVFLDYDGTLSPIVDDPDRAFMSSEMRVAVLEVAKQFPTAIISGRSRDKVKGFVELSNVYYAGSHGMDIMVPSDLDKQEDNGVLFQPAKQFLPAIQEIFDILKEETREVLGTMVEDNGFCVSVHFRHVKKEDFSMLAQKVKSVLEKYPEFRLTEGKKVMEIRPTIEWDKGYALEYFLTTLGLNNSSDVIPMYIGDDVSDEDAFKVIRRRGKGYPILVSSSPKATRALYSLKDPSEVLTFLLRLAKWKKCTSSSSRTLSQIWDIGN